MTQDTPQGCSPGSIKALDWQELSSDRGDGSRETTGWEADSGFGAWYIIEIGTGGFKVAFDGLAIGETIHPERAKSAAQEDFEKRVAGCLHPAQAVPERPSLSNARPVSDFATGRIPEFLEAAQPTQGGDKGEPVVNKCLRFIKECEDTGSIDHAVAFELVNILTAPQPATLAYSALDCGKVQKIAAAAIRTFCQSLGPAAVQMSHGQERIYYAGISLDALSVAVALALTSTSRMCPDCGRSIDGPTHAAYCEISSTTRDTP